MDPLLIQNNIPTVESTDIEGSTKITSIKPIRLQKRMVLLGLFLSVITSFLFALACSWSKQLVQMFFFKDSQLEKATHLWVNNNDSSFNIVKLRRSNNQLYFINRKLKYMYNSAMNQFKALEYELNQKQYLLKSKGNTMYGKFQELYGKCVIEIPKPNLFIYLLKELTAPFYILQYFSCVLWVLEGFTVLAVIMISVSLIFLTVNFFLLKNSIEKLRELAQTKARVLLYRGEKDITQNLDFQYIESSELVPGDIIAIENKTVIPCDCVLLSGDLLINEASLTGESIPIPKVPIDNLDEKVSFEKDRRNCLFEGTKVLVARNDNQPVIAIVARTGFSSFKGQIFRSVLYPKPQEFGFYSQGIKYLCFLATGVMIIYFALLARLISLEYSVKILTLRFFDALTWIVPPALPIFVSMCQTYSLLRLKYKGVYGIDPLKSLVSGKINTICFDKTGTLTTIGIDFYGFELSKGNKFQDLIQSDQIQDRQGLEFKLFGTCHGTYLIEGEMMGDSLDVELFKISGFQFSEIFPPQVKFQVSNNGIVLDVLKVYEFESALQRMSVIVREMNRYYIFVKGSPEKIHELSLPESIPKDFKQHLDLLTMKGLRILGFGFKELQQSQLIQYLEGNRNLCECDIQFMGLLAMENKLKQDTKSVIEDLTQSGLDLKIISGDNAFTTVQCARECSIITAYKPVLLVDYDTKSAQLTMDEIGIFDDIPSASYSTEESEQSTCSTNKEVMFKLVQHLLQAPNVKKSFSKSEVNNQTHCYAITGKAFDYFWAQIPREEFFNKSNQFAGFEKPLNSVDELHVIGLTDQQLHTHLFSSLVSNAKVFARMRPEQKATVVEQLQDMNRKVLMIGDGANDCAAIKQANVGVSFAQSDASYSAPYSSQTESIDCVKKILLDGRCTLQNACEVFQFYVGASVIKYVGAMILMSWGENFGDIQFIMLNYIGSLPFLFSVSLSEPIKVLSKVLPQEDMMDKSNFISISYQIIMASLGILCNYFCWLNADWREHQETKIPITHTFVKEGFLQSTLFISLLFYFVFAIIALYTSSPFKQKIYTHKVLLTFIAITVLFSFWLLFTFQNWQYSIVALQEITDSGYKWTQLSITFIFGMLMITGQELVLKRFIPSTQELIKKQRRRRTQVGE